MILLTDQLIFWIIDMTLLQNLFHNYTVHLNEDIISLKQYSDYRPQ